MSETDIIQGVVAAIVRDTDDPLKQGRIRVNFPWINDQHITDWIRIAAPMAGKDRGVCFLPEVGDEALVTFVHGRTRVPVVVGFMWNGLDDTPVVDVQERRIKSVNGHSIRFIDGAPVGGSCGGLVLEDGHGNIIAMSNGKITIKAPLVEINATTITLTGRGGYRRVIAHNNNPI